ncbi:MAG: helix-turn-helix transcriptional regulator [Syntrophales bacterium]
MGKKQDSYKTYGEKLIGLFVKLLFSGESYSLTELSRILSCSKQTVIRLIDDIDKSYDVEIDQSKIGNRHYYRIKKPARIPMMSVSETEFMVLQMCRDFTAHLLGKQLFMEATNTLVKSHALASGHKGGASAPFFSSYRPGTIDYTPHHDTIHTLIEAMKQKKVCKIVYQAIMETKPKTYAIMPLKLFSHKDTIYLHARIPVAKGIKGNPGGQEMEFDPLLAVHRIRKVALTDAAYEYPQDYDFEQVYNQNFGIIKDEAFKVEAEFTGWAAKYVAERIWSPDQKITNVGKGGEVGENKIILKFTASSEPEVISWILWFGEEARLIKPGHLVDEIITRIKSINILYDIGVAI